MKISLSLFCLATAIFASNVAEAQLSQNFGDPYAGQSAYQSVSGDLCGDAYGNGAPAGPGAEYGGGLRSAAAGRPGRMWLRSNIADRGLGYQGTYLTLGAKNRIFEDRLDGRWLVQGQIHHSIEDNGGMFANIGIERVFSIDAADADVSLSAWYDYDGDASGSFAHDFHQVGATAQVKTRKWDVIGNGYFPVGIQDYSFGDPSGANPFVGNNIVLIPGVDSALEGFDLTWRLRPAQMAIVNGTIDLGGYHYSSELVNSFGGGRVRMGFQAFRGMIVSAEVNHDERFDTTGVLSVGWVFGANGSGFGHEYSGIGRDLEQVVRNDHIVRFNQGVELAMDPLTGAAYNVVHVNNNADPAFEDGTAERPYATLQDAQDLSQAGDVIAVAAGDGTDRNMDGGINLKNNQRLFGLGTPYLIPVQNGQFFQLGASTSGIAPTLSNTGGFTVVQLANNNEVAGINIDGTGARFGIWGNGNSGSIHDNLIENASEDGVRIATPTGNWRFASNTIQNNGRDGIFIRDALDTASTFDFVSNTVNSNSFEGIHFYNYDPASIIFRNNTTSNNLRHGLNLQNYLNTSGNPLLIQQHVADSNAGRGVYLDGGDGNLRILDSTLTNNGGAGVTISNWTNTNPTDNIIIGTSTLGTSNISGNGALANLEFYLDRPGTRSNVVVTNQTLNDGVRGVLGRVAGIGTTMNIDIIDNLSINNNTSDGIRLVAVESGNMNARIGSTNASSPQQILDNAAGGGSGIKLIAQGPNGQPAARMNALVQNVTINNKYSRVTRPGQPLLIIPTDGISVDSLNNGVVNMTVRNATIGAADGAAQANGTGRDTQSGIRLNFDNDGSQLINSVLLDRLALFNDIGVILTTGTETYTDFSLTNSVINPSGPQRGTTGNTQNDLLRPFVGPGGAEGAGLYGVFISAIGQGTATGNFNAMIPTFGNQGANQSLSQGYSPFEIVSDGVADNLTRVNIQNNTIRDMTLEGITVSTHGDAEMLLNLKGNQILNNGAGLNDDANNNDSFTDQAVAGVADPNNLFFYDGVNIDAFDQSIISTRITSNTFRDNFERGLSLNTFNQATINAVVNNNTFFGNDRGEDGDNTVPPIGNGVFDTNVALGDSGIFDFEAINNEEFYIRDHEAQIYLNPANGTPSLLNNVALPGTDQLGIFYPINTGLDIFGNPVAIGAARLNLSMSNNSFQLGPDLLDFSQAPGDFTLGLDGATNGFVGPFGGITSVGFNFADVLVGINEGSFAGQGFSQPGH